MHQRDLKARTVAARQALLSDSQEIESCDPIQFMAFHENTDQFRIRDGRVEHFDEVRETGHDVALEWDWELCRSLLGAVRQRDAARWWFTHPAPGRFDWRWLDRLVAIAGNELILDYWHYGYPHWISDEEFSTPILAEHAAEYARTVAQRYPHIEFHCPCNEIRVAVDLMSRRTWRPWLEGRRHLVFEQICRATIAMSEAIKAANPRAQIVMAEPVNSPTECGYVQFCAPYDVLLGRAHPEWGGHESLVDVIGVNHYIEPDSGLVPLHQILQDMRERYPDKALWVTEASNVDEIGYLCYIVHETLQANLAGANVGAITQAPVICSTPWTGARRVDRGGLLTWTLDDADRCRSLVSEANELMIQLRLRGYLAGRIPDDVSSIRALL